MAWKKLMHSFSQFQFLWEMKREEEFYSFTFFLFHVVTRDWIILESSNCKFVYPFIKLGVKLIGGSNMRVINYIHICSYAIKFDFCKINKICLCRDQCQERNNVYFWPSKLYRWTICVSFRNRGKISFLVKRKNSSFRNK